MKNLTKEALAEMLKGNEYREEITPEQEALAKENNLIALFPHSDDNLEIRGAIDDELGAYDGGDFALVKKGELFKAEDDEHDVYHKADEDMVVALVDDHQPEAKRKIALVWNPADDPRSWTLTSAIPHASFDINDGGEAWANGIVIDLDEIQ